MNNNKSIYKLLLATTIFVYGCKSINRNEFNQKITIPKEFGENISSRGTIANIQWRQLFADSILISIIDTALKANPDMLIAAQRIEMARASQMMAKGATLPQVTANASGAMRKFGLYTMDGAGNITTEITPGKIVPIHLPDFYKFGLVSWELDIWGKLKNLRRSAIAQYFESMDGKNWVQTGLISELSSTYYQLIAADEELRVINRGIAKQLEIINVVQIQKEAGKTNINAINQFQSQLLELESMKLETEQKIVELENKINVLIGRFPQKINRQTLVPSATLLDTVEAGIPSEWLLNRPDIRAAENRLLSSRFECLAAKASFYPNINITAALGLQAFKTGLLYQIPSSIAYSAISGATLPIVNRKGIKAKFKESKAVEQIALYEYQNSIIKGYTEVVNELARLDNLKSLKEVKLKQTKVLDESIQTSVELFSLSRINYLEVLFAQQQFIQNQLDVNDLWMRQNMSIIQLYRALGGGWK